MSNNKPGGRTKQCIKQWRKITKDPFILQCVQGCKINFSDTPHQDRMPHQIRFNNRELLALKNMLEQYVEDGVIEPCNLETGDYVNTVFLREKSESTVEKPKFRMILNMKRLNKNYVQLIHHKINSLESCLSLLEENWYMASIDLRNAFHTIPMHEHFTKFLKFIIDGQAYKYLVLPMGYRDSPRLFCKILKPALTHLRRQGFLSSLYIDDFFITAKTIEQCNNNVRQTLDLLSKLGFEFSEKSSLTPKRQLKHLGFVINSSSMTVHLHDTKKKHITKIIEQYMQVKFITVKQLASIIGTLVATFPGVLYGPLFYRKMELSKIKALKISKNYNRKILFESECKKELSWWLQEGLDSHKPISLGNPDIIIQTDASNLGWGAIIPALNLKTQGFWSDTESEEHINIKEMRAALLGVQALCNNLSHCHIQLQMDNMTAVCYINNLGGTHSKSCNDITFLLISWCKNKHIWLSACHIAGSDNFSADYLSRKLNEDIEWSLNKACFNTICEKFGTPDIDVFASRINKQLPNYFSYFPDKEALGVDGFARKWDFFAFIFPPFSLLHRVLRKLREDNTHKAIVIAPVWKGATWYPKLQNMLIQEPLHLGNNPNVLVHPHKNKTHPLYPSLKLMACFLSGKNIKD